MADFKWALDVFFNSLLAFAATVATTALILLASSPRITFILMPIFYCLVLGFTYKKLKNWRITIGLLLNVIYIVVFYYQLIDAIKNLD